MSFEVRIDSVAREVLDSSVGSVLRRETGQPVEHWRRVVQLLVQHLWVPSEGRIDAVGSAAWVSAVYEWAARRDAESALDAASYMASGGHCFGQPPGSGPSMGPFQGYVSVAAQAIERSGQLRTYLAQVPPRADPGVDALRSQGVVHPGASGSGTGLPAGTGTMRDRIQRGLHTSAAGTGPYVSLVGKVELTLSYAREIRSQVPAAWTGLLDSTLHYAIVCHESGGGGVSYLNRLRSHLSAASMNNQGVDLIHMAPPNIGNLVRTYNALGITFSPRCPFNRGMVLSSGGER